jgi:signal transduction histidine kinase
MDGYTTEGMALGSSDPAHLATFPEQNPNAVIETDMSGNITYCNPEAVRRFPDLAVRGIEHPLVSGVLDIVEEFRSNGREFAQREVEFGDAVYEQKVCHSSHADDGLIRIFTHDVTAHRLAEAALADVARRVVIAQEEERKRVSRGLHDEAGQAMAALKISLDLLRQEPGCEDAGMGESLEAAIDLLDETWDQIRLLARDLRPPALDALGLDDTLDDFCAQFAARTRLDITYRGEAVSDIADAQEISLYRLLQEALANAAMHADASQVEVDLSRDRSTVRLTVSDDGTGMDPGILDDEHRRGLGIVGMRERIETLGGRFLIESGATGTTITAILPLEGT